MHESSVRSFKRTYYEQLQSVKDPDAITKLEGKKRRRSSTLPKEMESSLKKYIHKLKLNGGIVNKTIQISAAHGIVEYYNRSLSKNYGECMELSCAWAQSFMSRLGFVKRKSRKLPDDFPTIKLQFLEKIKNIFSTHKTPDQLVFNWYLTGINLVPQVTGPWLKRAVSRLKCVGWMTSMR